MASLTNYKETAKDYSLYYTGTVGRSKRNKNRIIEFSHDVKIKGDDNKRMCNGVLEETKIIGCFCYIWDYDNESETFKIVDEDVVLTPEDYIINTNIGGIFKHNDDLYYAQHSDFHSFKKNPTIGKYTLRKCSEEFGVVREHMHSTQMFISCLYAPFKESKKELSAQIRSFKECERFFVQLTKYHWMYNGPGMTYPLVYFLNTQVGELNTSTNIFNIDSNTDKFFKERGIYECI